MNPVADTVVARHYVAAHRLSQRPRPGLVILAVWMHVALSGGELRAGDVDFQHDIQPIFARRCVRCHRPGNAQSDIKLDTQDDLIDNQFIVPGIPDESELLAVVQCRDNEPARMPKEGEPLTAEQVELLARWIREGAEWPAEIVVREATLADATWWSLQPLVADRPRNTSTAPTWRLNAVDDFVEARLRDRGLSPSPPAGRHVLIRRATYDLTGLPPTPREIEAFLADTAPDAYPRLIDRLLASPAYGERWGRHWLDVVRFGESRGFERNEIIPNLWPFRDYIITSLNDDKPMDRLIREHLAGDQLGSNQPEVEVGTAFLVCGPYDDVGNLDPAQAAQIRANTIDELIRSTTEAFLGLTVGCARCHDHKFDPILQQDYYRLYATFAGVHHGSRPVATVARRDAVAATREPLEDQQSNLAQQLRQLEEQIRKRADAKGTEVDARATRPPVDRRLTRETFAAIEARYVQLVGAGSESDPAAAHGFTIDEFEVWTAGESPENVALADVGATAEGASPVAQDFAGAYSAALAIDGKLGARWLAAGPTLTIRLREPRLIDAVAFSSDRNGDAGDLGLANFVTDYEIRVSSDGRHWQVIADSFDRQPINDAHRQHRRREAAITSAERQRIGELQRELRELGARIASAPRLDEWWVGQMREATGPFQVFLGGDPQRAGDAVVPASLSVLEPVVSYRLDVDEPESVRRLALADWIVHPNNPLTARVLANRLWHYHFGTGIVSTPNDFGAMGQAPTHSRLLDFLADQMQRDGWRLKPLHRLIMLSQTYQQSSVYRVEAAAKDGDTRYLWRFPPRRLSAEEVRDSMLAVAGQLDRRMNGPGFRLYRYMQDNVATYVPLDEHGPETYRRAIYHHGARAARVDLLTDFDCPDSAFSAPRRATTTTPIQALGMLNHRFSYEMAMALAGRLVSEFETIEGQVVLAFQLAYARPAEGHELREAAELIQRFGLPAFCRALLNSNEFIHLE
jgi:hypothetical protein